MDEDKGFSCPDSDWVQSFGFSHSKYETFSFEEAEAQMGNTEITKKIILNEFHLFSLSITPT